MSSVLVAAVLVGFVTSIALLFIQIEKRKNRKHMNQFLTRFSELGALNNLTFSSQEILEDAAIGLDGVHRKLLILNGSNETTASNKLLYLNEIKTCTVKKQYGTIGALGLKNNKLEQYLEKLSLCFDMKNGREPAEVAFFHHDTGNIYQLKELEEKAKHWEIMLSKMLKSPLKDAA